MSLGPFLHLEHIAWLWHGNHVSYSGAYANGFPVFADDLDMVVVRTFAASGNRFVGGGDLVTSAPKSVKTLGSYLPDMGAASRLEIMYA